jgi:ABC-type Na+ efflux pump permease subunit
MLLTLHRHKAGGLWVIFIYLVYSLLTEVVNFIIQSDHHSTAYFNFNLFGIIEYCLLTYYIRSRIRNHTLKSLILVLSGIFLIVSIVRISGHYFNVYDSLSNGLESILLIIYSIFYFFEQISKPSHIFFYAIPEFWIIVAILLYFQSPIFGDQQFF